MNKIAIAVHGGAGEHTVFLSKHLKKTEEALAHAVQLGHEILKKSGSALDAVETVVNYLEDNPLFNAGKGSALNCKGEVEMDASIMDGEKLKAGAVLMVRLVKNPISLARFIMNNTHHVFLAGYGALEIANSAGLPLEEEAYFITENQYKEFIKKRELDTYQDVLHKKMQGTVGAVALDYRGNLAAGTSTGGTSNCLPGRVGDSCVIGAGCYANNKTCAVSGTGTGEYLITGVVAHTVSMMTELNKSIQEACDEVIQKRNKYCLGGMGVIAVSPCGEVGISFNSEVMKRAWISSDNNLHVKVY
jgi:beta-aspartyl-peptidase (threonine type)